MCQAMAELKHQYWLEGRNEGRSEGERVGLLKGRSEGRREGKNEGILFSAKKMLELGVTYEQIEEKLGVTRQEIEEYKGE